MDIFVKLNQKKKRDLIQKLDSVLLCHWNGRKKERKKFLRHEHLIHIKLRLKGGARDVIIRTSRKESKKKKKKKKNGDGLLRMFRASDPIWRDVLGACTHTHTQSAVNANGMRQF